MSLSKWKMVVNRDLEAYWEIFNGKEKKTVVATFWISNPNFITFQPVEMSGLETQMIQFFKSKETNILESAKEGEVFVNIWFEIVL